MLRYLNQMTGELGRQDGELVEALRYFGRRTDTLLLHSADSFPYVRVLHYLDT